MTVASDAGPGATYPTPAASGPGDAFSAGDVRDLRANRPLWLNDPSLAWRVVAGRAQLFAVDRSRDGKRAARHPLFEVEAGAMILPLPEGAPFDLVAVGIETGTTAVAEALGSLRAAAATGGPSAAEVRDGVEAWAEALVGAVAVPTPPYDVELRLPETSGAPAIEAVWSVVAGQVAAPVRRTIWLDGADDFLLYGSQPLGGVAPTVSPDVAAATIPDPLLIPVPVGAWMRVTSDGAVRGVAGEVALARPEGWRGLAAVEMAALRLLDERLNARAVEARAGLQRREELADSLVERSYLQLSSILVHGHGTSGPSGSGDELFGAFLMVGEALGATVTRPQRSDLAGGRSSAELIARTSGLRIRKVVLDENWWAHDVGPLVATITDTGQPVAILATRPGRYEIVDPLTLTRIKVDKGVAATIDPVATMVYRPLPGGPLRGRDVWKFALRPLRRELVWMTAFGLVAGLMSLITPLVTKNIFSSVVPGLRYSNLFWLTALLGVLAVSSFGFAFAQQIALSRAEGRSSSELQAAVWDRVLDLPLPFFRRFTAGALTQRVLAVEQIRLLATSTLSVALFALPVGVFNLILAFVLQPRLALFGSSILAVVVFLMVMFTRYQIVHITKMTEANQRAFGFALQLVDAVGKLRVANAERRAFSQWANHFARRKKSFYASQLGFVGIVSFSAGVPGLAALLVFLGAATLKAGTLEGSTFIAFNIAFLQATAAVVGLSGVAVFIAQAVPLYRSAKPILLESREVDTGQIDPGELSGRIEVSHVSLRYGEGTPPVLNDVSFSVAPGEFVALVGPSGAGKSTILRLLLGFERPEVGTVRYDGQDLETLDPRAVRQQLGVVTQSVRLLPGPLVANIIGNRLLTVDDAWAAAEVAGIADDIRAMPMGMQTLVAEGAATFAGGQRQRILIARAVAAKPRILFFDEATSALDNQTQSHVAAAISGMHATRVVIAHRLSTIRDADRIIVMEAGRIVQQGTFDELMAVEGTFSQLARRQLV